MPQARNCEYQPQLNEIVIWWKFWNSKFWLSECWSRCRLHSRESLRLSRRQYAHTLHTCTQRHTLQSAHMYTDRLLYSARLRHIFKWMHCIFDRIENCGWLVGSVVSASRQVLRGLHRSRGSPVMTGFTLSATWETITKPYCRSTEELKGEPGREGGIREEPRMFGWIWYRAVRLILC